MNARLDRNWKAELAPFSRSVAACNTRAVSLATKLHRSSNASLNQAHGESLREAMARCPSIVLNHVALEEVGTVCWVGESAQEKDYESETLRRIAKVRRAQDVSSPQKVEACATSLQEDLRRVKLGPWQGNQDARRVSK